MKPMYLERTPWLKFLLNCNKKIQFKKRFFTFEMVHFFFQCPLFTEFRNLVRIEFYKFWFLLWTTQASELTLCVICLQTIPTRNTMKNWKLFPFHIKKQKKKINSITLELNRVIKIIANFTLSVIEFSKGVSYHDFY